MKKLFIIIALTALCGLMQAQDAEYNLIRQDFTVNSDGTMDIHYRKEIKLLRNRTITAYADKGETFILYNPAIDELRINESYTIRKDGTRVSTPINALIDQLPSGCTNCGRYNGIRERVVVHTALEYDCIVVLDYTIHRRCNILDEVIQLNQDCPVKEYQITVKVPKGQHIDARIPYFENQYKGTLTENTYTLTAKKLEQTIIDSYLPPAEMLYPTLHISNGKSAQPAIYNFEPLPEATNLLMELYDKDPIKYITNIRNYVVDNVNYNNIPNALTAYKASTAKETFESNCGTLADKCALLAALLRQAEFKATATATTVTCTLYGDKGSEDYQLSPIRKGEIKSVNDSKPVKRNINIDEELLWNGQPIGGRYRQMTLPKEAGAFDMNPALLTSVRKAPVQVTNGKERYHYNIILPRTPKYHLVGEPVNLQYSKPGIGRIRISIKENIKGYIEVDKELVIDVEDGIVTEKQYKDFRQMVIDWNSYNTITIKPKMN